MPDRDVVERNEIGRAQPHRPLDRRGADWVHAIKHDEFHPGLGGGLHRQTHRRDVRVKSAANILDVEDECVQTGELFLQRLARLAVQAEDFQAAFRIGAVTDLFIELAVQPVLRAEKRLEMHPLGLEQKIERRPAFSIVAGVVGDQTDAAALRQNLGAHSQHVRAIENGLSRRQLRWGRAASRKMACNASAASVATVRLSAMTFPRPSGCVRLVIRMTEVPVAGQSTTNSRSSRCARSCPPRNDCHEDSSTARRCPNRDRA